MTRPSIRPSCRTAPRSVETQPRTSPVQAARVGRRRPYTLRRWAPPTAPLTVPDRVRVGVLGLGAVAQAVHLPLLDRLGDRFGITAVADLSPRLVEAIGERYRVPPANRFGSLAELLDADRFDALLILTSG